MLLVLSLNWSRTSLKLWRAAYDLAIERELSKEADFAARDMSACFPELVDELRANPHDFVCDGELVVLDDVGRPQWDRLKRRHVLRDPRRIARAVVEDPACIFAFDLLWVDGEDFRARPLLDRKWALYEGRYYGDRFRTDRGGRSHGAAGA
jgi:hypothetical protein